MMYLIAIDPSKSPNPRYHATKNVKEAKECIDGTTKQKSRKNSREFDRDDTIYRAYLNGFMDVCELSKYYGLSQQRICDIIQEQKVKKRRGDPDIYEIDVMCRILGWTENCRGKLQSTLHKNGYTSFDNKWRDLTYDDILAIPFLGPNAAGIIWLAQNMDVE